MRTKYQKLSINNGSALVGGIWDKPVVPNTASERRLPAKLAIRYLGGLLAGNPLKKSRLMVTAAAIQIASADLFQTVYFQVLCLLNSLLMCLPQLVEECLRK